MSPSKYQMLDLSGIRVIPFEERPNKVSREQFYKPGAKGWVSILSSLPDILAARDMKALVADWVSAVKEGKPVIVMMGAHSIKLGLGPLFVKMLKHKIVSLLAMNGSCTIHDSELARFGQTSEEVGTGIKEGTFGFVKETAQFINGAVNRLVPEGLGYGESIARALMEENPPYVDGSILATAYEEGIPITVHNALVVDINQMHPDFNASLAGEGSFRDFRIFLHVLKDMTEGGVIINIGSAVLLPLVLEKALAVVRNLGYDVKGFTGANLDFVIHYRANLNPVQRARELGGRGFNIIGHHEINVPLIVESVLEELTRKSG